VLRFLPAFWCGGGSPFPRLPAVAPKALNWKEPVLLSFLVMRSESILFRSYSVKTRCKMLGLTAIAVCAMLPAFAQSAGDDAAVLAKANTGEAAAQIQMGDQSRAAAAAVAHDPDQAADNYMAAAAWYRKAADQGSLTAQLRLAELYRDGGKGFTRDMAQAAEWYRKAAEQGDVGAQATLATLYSIGQGVQQSYVEAYYWLDLAASVKGPRQEQYAQNRQAMGAHITTDELDAIQDRVAKWLAAHPRPAVAE